MADHYDTAYMEDLYNKSQVEWRTLSAAGADDNCSATATLLQAAPIFLALAKEELLEPIYGCFILPGRNSHPIVWDPVFSRGAHR